MKKQSRNFFWQNFLKKNFYYLIRFYAHLRFSLNCPDVFSPNNIQFNLVYAQNWYDYLQSKFPLICKQIERLLHNHYEKKKRVKNRITKFTDLSEIVYFGTLTFRDDVLKSTNFETRRTYVGRFLKKYCVHYVANCDYGSLNEREHYHCCFISYSDFIDKWKYGFVNVKKVWSENDYTALSEYLLKLANHTTKKSASCVIYSRGK